MLSEVGEGNFKVTFFLETISWKPKDFSYYLRAFMMYFMFNSQRKRTLILIFSVDRIASYLKQAKHNKLKRKNCTLHDLQSNILCTIYKMMRYFSKNLAQNDQIYG